MAATDGSGRIAKDGDEVLVQYTGRLEDGTIFDAHEESDPAVLEVGAGQMVRGFDAALRGLRVGEAVKVTLAPEEAYGRRNESLVLRLPAGQVPAGTPTGKRVMLGGGGRQIPAVITVVNDDGSAVVDANPVLAGKTVAFDIKLLGFKPPPQRGLEMAGWHGQTVWIANGIANSPASRVFQSPRWPAAWPYTDDDFRRRDESDDVNFYDEPRFVTHIDDACIGAIRDFYAQQFAKAPQGEFSVLDICSSWISHYPADLRAKRVAVTGMVEKELAANKQATEYAARDLNKDPKLPYGDGEFDFVTNVVSVDYLSRPREIIREVHRVMKPGGVAIMSFSNRCFPTKAIKMWVANMNDGPGHCQIVGNYFHFSPEGGWRDISSADISANPGRSDPTWVVTAVKA